MKKSFKGNIVKVKMDKTVVVEISRRIPHPIYKKRLLRTKKFQVDLGDFKVEIGNEVKIEEIKPMSKLKHFKIVEVYKK